MQTCRSPRPYALTCRFAKLTTNPLTSLARWLNTVAVFLQPVRTLPAALIQHMSNKFVPPLEYGVGSNKRRECCYADTKGMSGSKLYPKDHFFFPNGSQSGPFYEIPGQTLTFSEFILGLGYELDPDAKPANMLLRPILAPDPDTSFSDLVEASCFPLKFFMSSIGQAYTIDNCGGYNSG